MRPSRLAPLGRRPALLRLGLGDHSPFHTVEARILERVHHVQGPLVHERGIDAVLLGANFLALADRAVAEKILRVCLARSSDPYAQRYHFWKHYAEQHLA